MNPPPQSRSQHSALDRPPWSRRVVAAGIDVLLVMTPLGALGVLNAARRPVQARTVSTPSQWIRVVVTVALTVPVSLALGYAEHHGGTPGKQLMGLRTVGLPGHPVGLSHHLVRSCAKTAVAWELGHQSVWEFVADHPRRGTVLSVAAHALVAVHVVAMARGSGRTPADALAGTVVVSRACLDTTGEGA